MPKRPADILFLNGGSIWVFTPASDAGRSWCDENLPEDAPRFGDGYAVEPRYGNDIGNGMIDAGLCVRPLAVC